MKKIVVVLAVLVVALLFGLLLIGQDKADESHEEFYTTDANVFKVETTYCNLCYPEKWENDIKIEKIENEDSLTIKFCTDVDGATIPLFDVGFNEEAGTLIGEMVIDNEKIKVYIVSYDNDFSEYSSEQQNDLYDMVESVNVIISKLIEEYNLELI